MLWTYKSCFECELSRQWIFMQQCKTTFGIPVGMTQKCGKWGGICIKNIFFVSNHHTLTNNPSKCSSWWVLWYKWFMQISIIIRSTGVKRSQKNSSSSGGIHTRHTCSDSTVESLQWTRRLFNMVSEFETAVYTIAQFSRALPVSDLHRNSAE